MRTVFSMRQTLLPLAALAVALGIGAVSAEAQPPFQIQSDTYRVRIVNEMGQQIRLKVIGFSHQSRYSVDLYDGRWVSQDFYAGPRMLGIFDARGDLLVTAPLMIDRSGTLRLRGIFAAEARTEGAADAPAPVEGAAPSSGFKIE